MNSGRPGDHATLKEDGIHARESRDGDSAACRLGHRGLMGKLVAHHPTITSFSVFDETPAPCADRDAG
jgi:hypothetical protein